MAEWKLDEPLRGVHSLCERWVGEAYRFGLSSAMHPMWRGERGSGEEPVVSDEVMLLDKVLATSDPHIKKIIRIWYAYDDPVAMKAKKMGVSRPKMYDWWKRSLEYLRGRLHSEGLQI